MLGPDAAQDSLGAWWGGHQEHVCCGTASVDWCRELLLHPTHGEHDQDVLLV